VNRLSFTGIVRRFGLCVAILVPLNVVLGAVFSRLTDVPPSFAAFTPLPVLAGSIGGALIATLGYLLCWSVLRDVRTLNIIFVTAGTILLIASYYLPWRLTFSTSPRFAGVTVPPRSLPWACSTPLSLPWC
jgi:hypothetical protein